MKILTSPTAGRSLVDWEKILRPKPPEQDIPPGYESVKQIATRMKCSMCRVRARIAEHRDELETRKFLTPMRNGGWKSVPFYRPKNYEPQGNQKPRRHR